MINYLCVKLKSGLAGTEEMNNVIVEKYLHYFLSIPGILLDTQEN